MSATTAVPQYRKNIFDACLHNDVEAVRLFVEGVPVTSVNSDKQTAAHIASKNGNIAILRYLLDKDPSLVYLKDHWDQTVLHLAVKKGSLEVIKFLVDECNANMNEPSEHHFGNTPIHMAAQDGNLEILKYFVENKKADVNIKNDYGEPPAFPAAEKKQMHIIRYLSQQNADLTMLDKNNMNILFTSATIGDISIPRLLLDQLALTFDIDWKDNFGDTVLHRAVWNNRYMFVKYVVSSHNANVNAIDTWDRTALHVASMKGNIALVRFLVGHGSNTELEDCMHRRAIEAATTYEVVDYLESMQGYQFTLYQGSEESTSSTHETTFPTPMPFARRIKTTATTKKQKRARVRARRSAPREVQSNFENLLYNWSLRSISSNNREDGLLKAGFGIENLLVIAETCMKYFNGFKSQGGKTFVLSSPRQILNSKMSSIAVDAINAFSEFEDLY